MGQVSYRFAISYSSPVSVWRLFLFFSLTKLNTLLHCWKQSWALFWYALWSPSSSLIPAGKQFILWLYWNMEAVSICSGTSMPLSCCSLWRWSSWNASRLKAVTFCLCLSWVLEPLLSALLRRMPDLEALQIMQLVNCPESFTPDMRCIMGESPTVRGYFVLAGMNSAGISYGGGAGK